MTCCRSTRHLDKLTDYPTNANIAMVSGFMCAETDEAAQAKAAGWTFFVRLQSNNY